MKKSFKPLTAFLVADVIFLAYCLMAMGTPYSLARLLDWLAGVSAK